MCIISTVYCNLFKCMFVRIILCKKFNVTTYNYKHNVLKYLPEVGKYNYIHNIFLKT